MEPFKTRVIERKVVLHHVHLHGVYANRQRFPLVRSGLVGQKLQAPVWIRHLEELIGCSTLQNPLSIKFFRTTPLPPLLSNRKSAMAFASLAVGTMAVFA
jgi:hypothetical protein